jgi:hypothetical protein
VDAIGAVANDKSLLAGASLETAALELSANRPAQAAVHAARAMELRPGDRLVASRAGYLQGLALTARGAVVEGERLCAQSLQIARMTGHDALTTQALLAHSETLVALRDPARAAQAAEEARDRARRADQKESEWRSSVLIAEAARLQGDAAGVATAAGNVAALQRAMLERLGPAASTSYLARPDLRRRSERLREISRVFRPPVGSQNRVRSREDPSDAIVIGQRSNVHHATDSPLPLNHGSVPQARPSLTQQTRGHSYSIGNLRN